MSDQLIELTKQHIAWLEAIQAKIEGEIRSRQNILGWFHMTASDMQALRRKEEMVFVKIEEQKAELKQYYAPPPHLPVPPMSPSSWRTLTARIADGCGAFFALNASLVIIWSGARKWSLLRMKYWHPYMPEQWERRKNFLGVDLPDPAGVKRFTTTLFLVLRSTRLGIVVA